MLKNVFTNDNENDDEINNVYKTTKTKIYSECLTPKILIFGLICWFP